MGLIERYGYPEDFGGELDYEKRKPRALVGRVN